MENGLAYMHVRAMYNVIFQ